MSILRIFRVRIDSAFRQEFEEKFSSTVLYKIKEAPGIHFRERVQAHEMESGRIRNDLPMGKRGRAAGVLRRALERARHLPRGAEEFVVASWLHHFESWDV